MVQVAPEMTIVDLSRMEVDAGVRQILRQQKDRGMPPRAFHAVRRLQTKSRQRTRKQQTKEWA